MVTAGMAPPPCQLFFSPENVDVLQYQHLVLKRKVEIMKEHETLIKILQIGTKPGWEKPVLNCVKTERR